jgi:hypothetical protein
MAANYSELLRHPFWQRKRLLVFQRDNFACVKCNDSLSNLQVHHKYYKPNTNPWDYPDDALITLCELCHEKTEFIKCLYSKGQAYLIKLGLTLEDTHEVLEMIARRLQADLNKETSKRYMLDLRMQLNG